jgi:hypothetical protein
MAETTYIVNHTLLGTGHAAGEVFPVKGGKVTDKNTGKDVDVDLDRLLGLFAIREATPEDRKALDAKGLTDPNAILMGDAPDGQTRVSSDTFAPVDPASVTNAGGDQSDADKGQPDADKGQPDADKKK